MELWETETNWRTGKTFINRVGVKKGDGQRVIKQPWPRLDAERMTKIHNDSQLKLMEEMTSTQDRSGIVAALKQADLMLATMIARLRELDE